MQLDKHYGPHCSTTSTQMQLVFLGNYVFWAWNLEVKDSNFWIPEVVHENAIPQQEQTQAHCTAFQSIPKHCFYVMMDTDTVCCVYDLYDVYNASKAIPDVNFYVK